MAEQPERQRIKPTRAGQARLLADLASPRRVHVVGAGTLGEYAQVLMTSGQDVADDRFPDVAEHLEAGCTRCEDDLDDLVALLEEPDDPPSGAGALKAGGAPAAALRTEQEPDVGEDSGVFAADLPDPRAVEAEATRRQRLRRIRDLLLIAAAISVLLIGLSLIGLAYVARQVQEPVRVPLVPEITPGQSPGQPAIQPGGAPAQAPTGGGRAAPDGTNCPASHPIKGNRESMIYHLPGGMSYAATRPEVCFALPSDAEADGYRRSQR